MPSPAQIARERERVRRAVADVQKRLRLAFDVKLVHEDSEGNDFAAYPRAWPLNRTAFYLDFDAGVSMDLSAPDLREDVVHEVLHMVTWPVRASATRGMTDEQSDRWSDEIEEPVIRELTRIVATHALGRWSQR